MSKNLQTYTNIICVNIIDLGGKIKMSLSTFLSNISLITKFANRLENERIDIVAQRILVRTYAKSLRINLTDSMISEIMG